MAGPLIGSKNACIGVLVVMSKEALTESVAIPVAVQHTVTVLVVSESVFLTTSFMLLVSEGVPVVLLIKVFGSETHLVEAVGVEDVLEWKGKGKVEEDLFQLSLPFGESEIQRSSPSICVAGGIFFIVPTGLEEFLDEGKKVKDEGVPHEVEGDGGPVVVAVLQQVVEGDAIGCHVRDRQDRVEEGKLCNLDHLDGHQEAKTFDNRSNYE